MLKKIHIPIFSGYLLLYQDCDVEEVCKKHGFSNDICDAMTGVDHYRNDILAFVTIFINKNDLNTMAHEAVHFAHFLIREAAMNEDEELIAYLSGWFMEQCSKYLWIDIRGSAILKEAKK